MKRIALINQRCGRDVNGGSESYTIQIAKKLSEYYDVDIITTTAKDYILWENYYKAGEEYLDNIRVIRFPVEHRRNVFVMKLCRMLLDILPFKLRILEELWVDAQGPYCPKMVRYIKNSYNKYEIYIFITYLYYHSVRGLPEVAKKAVFIPTAHNEPPIYYDIYKHVFESAKAIGYLTEEEQSLAESIFRVTDKPSSILGVGIDIPEAMIVESGMDFEYIVYVGRLDASKGCDTMFSYFRKYKDKYPGELKLVVVGKAEMDIPQDDDIIATGFIDEGEKYGWIRRAKVLVLPSKYESLSLSVLEAMYLGVPVIVNGTSKVLDAHCRKSGAGFIYHDAHEFIANLHIILTDNIIYEEMRNSLVEMENGVSDVEAIHEFGIRCVVPEIRKFTSTIVQSMSKGNSELSLMLQEQSKEVWNLKKQILRREGEKASSRLLIPISIMFIGILIMIIVPIFANLGNM